MIGKTLLQYRIIEKLGEGGMGVVYKALDTKLQRFVALKFLPHDVRLSAEDEARFLQEARAASAISHPNVCVIHDIAESDGQQFIVMEYVDGKTLRQMVPIEKVQDALGYATQVGEALAEAHSKGIVHRDIKTDNIMVNAMNQVKVMDFGLAKLRGSPKLTKTSSTVGTLSYMAPEQIRGGEVDARSDIFSFGVVLYEMLTGQLPFVGEHEAAMMYSILNESPQPIQKFRAELSSEVLHILNRALEKDPEERYQSVREMVIDLRRAKKDSSKISRTSPADIDAFPRTAKIREEVLKTPYPEPRRARRKVLIPAVLAIVAVTVAVASVVILRKQPTRQPVTTHKQVTFTGKVGVAAISPDGEFIAYASQVSPTVTKLFVRDLSGGEPLEVFKDKSIQEVHWSPDGSELLLFAKNDSVRGSYIVPRLGGTSRRGSSFIHAAWSPDGSRVAVNWIMPDKRIWFRDKMTGDTSSISLKGDFSWLDEIDWSPTGDLLLFDTFAQKRYAIWTIRTDASQQYKVVEDSVRFFSPRFSSRGDAVYYSRLHGQTNDLMKVKIDPKSGKPKSPAAVIQTGLQGALFSISKDNRRLLYTRGQSYSNLWRATYQDGQIRTRRLTEGSSYVFSPRISPDGEKVAFSMGNELEANIFVMPVEGGTMKQLTFFSSYSEEPVWSPDGKEIAFGSVQGGVPRVWKVNSNGGLPRPFKKSELSRDAFILAWAPCSKILYQRPGNRNYQVLDPETEQESPLVANDSVGWMFCPQYSPDCGRVAVWWNREIPKKPGVWLISLADSSQIFLQPLPIYPTEWSPEGKWIYAGRRVAEGMEILMVAADGNGIKELLTLPYEDLGDFSVFTDGKKLVYTLRETQSDAWLMENFDPDVK